MVNISGVGAPNPNQGNQAAGSGKEVENSLKTLLQELSVFDNEAQGLAGTKLTPQQKTQQEAMLNQKQIQQRTPEEVIAQAASLLTEEEIKAKKKEKKTPLEQKMDELAMLEGNIDETMLNKEEKGTISEFFDNMKRIKNLKRRLKQLQEEEEKAKKRLEDHNKKKKQ